MEERVNCLCLIFEGPSSSGKSFILKSLDPHKDPAGRQFLYKTDKFTPAAFLSHSADKTAKELEKIDMLPRIAQKLLVTPELSEMFGEEEHKLRANFATLTSVLDGGGQSSDSGAQGRREIIGDYTFNWIGASTQIHPRVYKVMGTMGSRLLIFEFPDEERTPAEAEAWLKGYEPQKVEREMHAVMQGFVQAFFAQHPVGTVPVQAIHVGDDAIHEITQSATLISHGRQVVQREGLFRLQLLLRMLVQGSAIVHGRYVVNADDLEIIKHVSISTIPLIRRTILRTIQARGMAHCSQTPGNGIYSHLQLDDFVSTGIAKWRGTNSIVIENSWKWVL